MNLHEDAVATCCHRSAGQNGREFTVTGCGLSRAAGSLHRMSGVKNDAVPFFAHPKKGAHIRHKIVVTKGGAAFGEAKPVVPKSNELLRNVLHVPWREELAFLYINRAVGLGRGTQEIGLT